MNKILVTSSLAIAFLVALSFSGVNSVGANPLLFYSQPVNFASTSVIYMSPGTATTTNVIDSSRVGPGYAIDSASLLIEFIASSTASTLKWKFEFSQDGIDWYSDNQELSTNATTTTQVRDFKEFSWTFASTTVGTQTAPQSTGRKLISVPTPTRFTRTVFYLPAGSTNAAVASQYVTKAQSR